jgi:hypothetical protein
LFHSAPSFAHFPTASSPYWRVLYTDLFISP